MTKRNLFINVAFLLIAITFSAISLCSCALSNKRLCYDPECSEPISFAKTTIKYSPNEPGLLPFDVNVNVTVYSKEAGNRTDLWGVEINGKRGYVPKAFLREYKVLQKVLHHEVPINQVSSDNSLSSGKLKPKKNKSSKVATDAQVPNAQNDNSVINITEKVSHNASDLNSPYNVIDGTTFQLDRNEQTVLPNPVAEVVQATTVVPNQQGAVDTTTASSNSEEVESNIFATDKKLLEGGQSEKIENSKENFPGKLDIKDFVTSSEETLDVPEITGIQVPPLDINTSSKDGVFKEIEKTIQSTENATIESKDAQPKEELRIIPVSEVSAPNDTKEAPNENVPSANINDRPAFGSEEKNNTESGEAVTTNSIKDTQTVQDVTGSEVKSIRIESETQLKAEQTESKDSQTSENNLITDNNTGDSVSSLLAESNVNNLTEVTLSSNSDEVVVSEHISTKNAESISGELNLTHPLENNVVEVTSHAKVPVTSQDIVQDVQFKTEPRTETETKEIVNKTVAVDNILKSPTQSEAQHQAENETKEIVNETIAVDNILKNPTQYEILHQAENETKEIVNETIAVDNILKNPTQYETQHKAENETKEIVNETIAVDNILKNPTQYETQYQAEKEVKEMVNETIAVDNTLKNPTQYKTQHQAEKEVKEMVNETIAVDNTLKNPTQYKTQHQAEKEVKEMVNETIAVDNTLKNPTQYETQHQAEKEVKEMVNETIAVDNILKNPTQYETQQQAEKSMNEIVNETTVADNVLVNDSNEQINVINQSLSTEESHIANEYPISSTEKSDIESSELLDSAEEITAPQIIVSSNEFHNRNLLNADIPEHFETENAIRDETAPLKEEVLSEYKDDTISRAEVLHEDSVTADIVHMKEATSEDILHEVQVVSPPDVCLADNVECFTEDKTQNSFVNDEATSQTNEYPIMEGLSMENSYWSTLMYLSVTATATILFSLGYYYIENLRRDRQLIARINKLEKDLLVSTKECAILTESLKLTKDKLTSIEDESFGSNEMVLSLKADLEASQNVKAELEEQVAILERDLESATEAGLELERMLRECLSSDNEVNPLAQSVEDLQTRLNAQQAANESLTNALNLKTQENESLTVELASLKRKYEELEVELTQVTENLKAEENSKNSMEKTLTDKVQQLEMQIKEISTDKIALQKALKGKEVEMKHLTDVISRLNSNNLDLNKLYDVSRIKAEASALLEERNILKERLTEVEGAHSLLEEHMQVINEEISTLSEQCKMAEKEKKDAETRLEVLSSFFQEKEAQRQKEEAIWLQQQGEVVSTVERIQTMQNEIQNYKQQVEMLKHEILDQEREYKNQISILETKAHEQWVVARQVERRLEESKVEAGQLRNRLTLIEKNINDVDSEAKLHRLETNGETTTSPPLFLGAESSSSPIMFSGSGNVPPPPPPSYLHSLFPPYLPPPLPNASGVPPYEVSQRPPPLGGRLSSPPPMPLHPSSRYDNASSPPPPMSPHLLPPFDHRSPPLPPFGTDHMHPPPPPPGSILPPPLGTTHSWGEDSLPPPRNSGFHPPQRERVRNHKGSLHSSGESLDKTHHNSKV